MARAYEAPSDPQDRPTFCRLIRELFEIDPRVILHWLLSQLARPFRSTTRINECGGSARTIKDCC